MTAKDVIDLVDELDPSAISAEIKMKWLNAVEEQIWREIVMTHETAEREEFVPHTFGREENMLVPDAYADVYRYYLEAKIAQANAEMDRYNSLVEAYNAAFSTFKDWYGRTHCPVRRVRKLRFI
ncbi:MAG: hypothetical protein KBS74_02200 [Clostridiales bacterium]|nr:hypothetical protein [Candidatus Cacconaster stercorequi]